MNFDEMPSPTDIAMPVEAPQMGLEAPKQRNELQEALSDYWAIKPASECVEECIKRAGDYYNYILATGKMAIWRQSFEQYNRGLITLASISRGGVEGELINLPVNEFRNILQHLLTLTTQEKLAYEPQAINSDYKTGAEVTLAASLLEYYAKHKGMDKVSAQAVEDALVFSEGSVLKLWSEDIGDIAAIDPQEKKVYKKGDIQYINLNPIDLIRDIHCTKFEDNSWFIIRIFVNKYELAAQHPEHALDIVKCGILHDWDNSRLTNSHDTESDLVPLYMMFHKPTSALPFGRQIAYLDKDIWWDDGHLKYRDMPINTLIPSPSTSINFGYSVAFDLLPLQQVVDILYGCIATNNINFATVNILVPDNCNLGTIDIVGGMNFLKCNMANGKPEALQLTLTPKEVYDFLNLLVQRMNVLAGINDVVRGQPEASLKSGAALALMAAQAIHFNSGLHHAYVRFIEQLGTGTLHDIQDFADIPRVGLLVGKANQAYLKEFCGKNIEHIDRVIVSVGSAFSQTTAGRLQMAQDLLGSGALKDPASEYLEVLKTGSLDRLTQGDHNQLMLIQKENELLAQGQPCQVIATQDHVTHILEHNNVLADPGLLNNPGPEGATIIQNTLTHINEHIMALQGLNPLLAAVLKQPVVGAGPQGPAAGAPPPAPGQQPQGTPGNPAPKPVKGNAGAIHPQAPQQP